MAGHLSKRKGSNGKPWRARYPDPTRGGTAQIERRFRTRREAERWLTAQQSTVHRGTHIDPKDTERLFRHVTDAWRSTWLELEPKTKAGYESILNKHVLPRWRDARIGAVSAESIQEWVNELAASGRAPNTIRRIYGVLRAVLKVAVERHYLNVNPCDAVRLPRRGSYGDNGEHREMLFLSPAEVAALADAITPHYRVLVYTAAYAGLRAGELGALRRRDVDLLHGKLNVARALKDISTSSENIAPEDKGLIFGPTKTGKVRTLGLPRFLVAMLTDHLEAIPADPDALVFTSGSGGPLRHGNFYRRHFKPAVRRRYCSDCNATVKPDDESCPECEGTDFAYVLHPSKHGLRFHDLRHTCAALLIAADAHPKAIQDHLGHRDIQTTFNVYGHLLPAAQEALAAALDTVFAGEQPDNVRSLPTPAGASK
jgi:integrase